MNKITVSLYNGKKNIYHNRKKKKDAENLELIADSIFNIREYEEGYKAILGRLNPVILDVGANVGMASIYFSQLNNSKIYAIEPSKENYKCLVRNTKNLNVKTLNYGVSAFNCESKDFGQETLYCKRRGISVEEKIRTRNMEWIFKNENIDHVDLMKIDVEGSEYEIFFTSSFRKVASKIDFIIGESHMGIEPFYPQDLVPTLGDMGFEVGFLPNVNYKKEWEVLFAGENGAGEKVKLSYPMSTLFFAKHL